MNKRVMRTALRLLLCMVMLCTNMLSGFVPTAAVAAGTTDVTVNIVWDDGDDADGLRPESVSVQLWQYWTSYGFEFPYEDEVGTLNMSNNWTYTWKNLSLDVYGEQCTYKLGSSNLYSVANYEVPVISHVGDNWTITYKHTPTSTPTPTPTDTPTEEPTSVPTEEPTQAPTEAPTPTPTAAPGTSATAKIVWDDGDNADGLRPDDVEVALVKHYVDYSDILPDQNLEYVKLNEANGWKHTWSDLPLDESGAKISYYVQLTATSIGGYSIGSNNDNDVWTITLTHTPTSTPVPTDTPTEAPTVTPTEEPTSTPTEAPTEAPEPVTSVTVNIVWDDGNDADGLRPESVKVDLEANLPGLGGWIPYYDNVILNADNVILNGGGNIWTKAWLNLPLSDRAFGDIKGYRVLADSIENYGAPVITHDENNWTITYTHTPAVTPEPKTEVTSVTVNIVWNDNNDENELRPESINVDLDAYFPGLGAWISFYDNFSLNTDNVIMNEDGSWTYTWSELPLSDIYFGNITSYRVSADSVKGYEAPVITKTGNNWTITYNRLEGYTPGKTDVSVSIEWKDDDEANRPEEVEVTLYANMLTKLETIKLTADNDWKHTWTDLPERNDSETIIYTVNQHKLPGYSLSSSISRTESTEAKNGSVDIVLTNTAVEEVSVTVNVEWRDLDNVDRPTEIELRLYRGTGYTPDFDPANNPDKKTELVNEEMVYNGGAILTAADGWTYTWEGLPKYYADGKEYVYTVREVVPEHYSVDLIKGENGEFTLINKACDLSIITIAKNWDDEDDQDGKRPSSIFVDLYRSDDTKYDDEGKRIWEFVETLEVKAADGWQLTVEDVLYYPGVEYKIEEKQTIDGYTTVIKQSGTLVNGDYQFDITNAYTPEVTQISVEKVWNDSDDAAGMRPEQIEVTLTGVIEKDGNEEEVLSDTVTISYDEEAESWTYTWDELPVYAKGAKITYTVEEGKVDKYDSDVKDNGDGTFTITNTYVKPAPTDTPEPTSSPKPTGNPDPAKTPVPTDTPEPTGNPDPAKTPVPTDVPAPTEAPTDTPTEAPTDAPDVTPAVQGAQVPARSRVTPKPSTTPTPESESPEPSGSPNPDEVSPAPSGSPNPAYETTTPVNSDAPDTSDTPGTSDNPNTPNTQGTSDTPDTSGLDYSETTSDSNINDPIYEGENAKDTPSPEYPQPNHEYIEGPATTSAPRTGDENNFILWILLSAMFAAGAWYSMRRLSGKRY